MVVSLNGAMTSKCRGILEIYNKIIVLPFEWNLWQQSSIYCVVNFFHFLFSFFKFLAPFSMIKLPKMSHYWIFFPVKFANETGNGCRSPGDFRFYILHFSVQFRINVIFFFALVRRQHFLVIKFQISISSFSWNDFDITSNSK